MMLRASGMFQEALRDASRMLHGFKGLQGCLRMLTGCSLNGPNIVQGSHYCFESVFYLLQGCFHASRVL
jgi:hypothetical protein